jgi:hypothetical protein
MLSKIGNRQNRPGQDLTNRACLTLSDQPGFTSPNFTSQRLISSELACKINSYSYIKEHNNIYFNSCRNPSKTNIAMLKVRKISNMARMVISLSIPKTRKISHFFS